MRLSLAGCALSVATATKISNGLLAAAALIVVFLRGRRAGRAAVPRRRARVRARRARLLADVVPEAVQQQELVAGAIRSTSAHVVSSWTHSSIFTPHTLAIVVPLAVVGAWGVRRPWALALVLAFAAGQSGLLQLLRRHGAASALPLREPAGAVRPLGRRHRGPPLARAAAACGAGGGDTRLVKTLRAIAVGWVVLLAACSLPNVGLWNPNGKADTGLYSLYGTRIAHGHLPYRSGFSMEFPPGAIPPLALPALPGSHYVPWFKGFALVYGLAAVAAVAFALAGTLGAPALRRGDRRRRRARVPRADHGEQLRPLAGGARRVGGRPRRARASALGARAARRRDCGEALPGAARARAPDVRRRADAAGARRSARCSPAAPFSSRSSCRSPRSRRAG